MFRNNIDIINRLFLPLNRKYRMNTFNVNAKSFTPFQQTNDNIFNTYYQTIVLPLFKTKLNTTWTVKYTDDTLLDYLTACKVDGVIVDK